MLNSFKHLLTVKSLDKITVKEICEHSKVNRQTFYNHFADLMDIFKTMFYEELSARIARNKTFATWQKGFLATMYYLRENSRMVLHVFHSSYWPEVKDYCAQLSNKLVDNVVGECVEKMGVQLREEDRKFIVEFYRLVLYGLILDWIREEMNTEPELILNKLLTIISGGIPGSVAAFSKEEKDQ